jgi:tetratricopeptide (TPR) repeat protein
MDGAMKSAHIQLLAALLISGGVWPSAAQEQARPPTRSAPSPEAVKAMKDGVEAMRRSDWKQAAEAWDRSVKLEPANAGAWANLGKVQLQQKETAAAIVSLEKAVDLQPALSEAWMALGMAYDADKAPMRAVSCLTRAVHENPADARTRNSLAVILKKAGWKDAAESELQKALDLDPRYSEAHFNLAVMYVDRRPPSLEMARRHYEAARSLGAEPDKDLEAQLAGTEAVVNDAPPAAAPKPPAADKAPAKPAKPTRPKP